MCFGRKKTLDGLTPIAKLVLTESLELVIAPGVGNQDIGRRQAVGDNKLTGKQVRECGAFIKWYRELVSSQPNLAEAYGSANYKAVLGAMDEIEKFSKS